MAWSSFRFIIVGYQRDFSESMDLEIVELSRIGGFSSQNGIFHSNGDNFSSRKDFLASPKVLTSLSSRLPDAQKIGSIRPLGAKCEHVIY